MFKKFFLTKKAKKFQKAVALSSIMVSELAFAKEVENGLEQLGNYVKISSWYGQKILPLIEGLSFHNHKRQDFIVGLKAVLLETAPSQAGWNRTPPEHSTYFENVFVMVPPGFWSKTLKTRSVVEYCQIKDDPRLNFNGVNEYCFVEKVFVNSFIHNNYSKLSKIVAEYADKKS